MRIGLIGAGNMATALARGWREPVLVSDVDHARAQALAAELGGEALALFGRIGTVVPTPEPLIDTAMAVMSCSPAFFALVVEALVDAGVRNGLQPDDAGRMVVEAMAGTAAVLREN